MQPAQKAYSLCATCTKISYGLCNLHKCCRPLNDLVLNFTKI
nr:MAG TPA: hypothetical protein [Caudoviricetes sp.]